MTIFMLFLRLMHIRSYDLFHSESNKMHLFKLWQAIWWLFSLSLSCFSLWVICIHTILCYIMQLNIVRFLSAFCSASEIHVEKKRTFLNWEFFWPTQHKAYNFKFSRPIEAIALFQRKMYNNSECRKEIKERELTCTKVNMKHINIISEIIEYHFILDACIFLGVSFFLNFIKTKTLTYIYFVISVWFWFGFKHFYNQLNLMWGNRNERFSYAFLFFHSNLIDIASYFN